MWMFGMMDKEEMTELKKGGYKVKKYSEHAFNKFLEPKQKFKEFKSNDSDLFLAGLWVDGDLNTTLSCNVKRST